MLTSPKKPRFAGDVSTCSFFSRFCGNFLKKAAPHKSCCKKATFGLVIPKVDGKTAKNDQKIDEKWIDGYRYADIVVFRPFLVYFWWFFGRKSTILAYQWSTGGGGTPPWGVRNGLWGGYPPWGVPWQGLTGPVMGYTGGGTPP